LNLGNFEYCDGMLKILEVETVQNRINYLNSATFKNAYRNRKRKPVFLRFLDKRLAEAVVKRMVKGADIQIKAYETKT